MTRRRRESCGALLGREPHALPEGDDFPCPALLRRIPVEGRTGRQTGLVSAEDLQSSRPHRRCPAVRLLDRPASRPAGRARDQISGQYQPLSGGGRPGRPTARFPSSSQPCAAPADAH